MWRFSRLYRETESLINKSKFKPQEIIDFTYRGNGQPGFMTIIDKDKKKKMLPYPNYAKMTGIMKDHRCRTCIDATGELADISCGDAWLEKYTKQNLGWSIVMTRSMKGEKILKDMINKQLMVVERISKEDVIESQKGNITSKKVRQHSRRLIYKIFRIPIPEWEGGFIQSNTGLFFEIKVLISTFIFHIAEILGLYDFFIKFLKRRP